HRKVEELFEQFERAKGEGRKEKLAHDICLELSVHAAIEEEIFYPACQGTVDEDLLKEGYVEHDAAKLLIAEIEAGAGKGDEFFDVKVKVLQEEVDHHVEDEEKPGGVFAQARKGKLDLDGLGEQLARCGARLAAQQPPPKPLGVLQADAAGAQRPVLVREQILVGRIMEVDVERVGERNLDPSHRVERAGQLTDFDHAAALRDRAPV